MQEKERLSAIKAMEEEVEFYQEKVKHLKDSIAFNKLKLGDSITNKVVETDESDLDSYDVKLSAAKKLLYFLKQENRFLHFREVAQMIAAKEGITTSEEEITKIAGKISSGTHSLKQARKIVKYQASKSFRDTFWGSKNWIDDNGNPKKGYEGNPEYIGAPPSDDDFDI